MTIILQTRNLIYFIIIANRCLNYIKKETTFTVTKLRKLVMPQLTDITNSYLHNPDEINCSSTT